MDYIQQAIDKARDKRDGNIGQERSGGRERAVSEQAGIPESINYTKTRQATIDSKKLLEKRIIAHAKFDKRADVYRQLRTQVIQKLRANDWNTIAVSSPNNGAGKTTTAVNLAISLSKEVNQTVMLVDLNLRNPGVLDALSISTEFGLVDHLRGEVSIEEILINPGFERMVILPGKADPNYSSEILSSPAMKTLVHDLTSRYESRIIIFDLPALLSSDDALAFIPAVDATLLVVEEGVTTEDEIERSLQLLEGNELLGVVQNKAD